MKRGDVQYLTYRERPMVIQAHNIGCGQVKYPGFTALMGIARRSDRKNTLGREIENQIQIDFNPSQFSVRELEILQLRAIGKSDKEVASCLNISIQTVKNILASVMSDNSTSEHTIESAMEPILLAEGLELLYPISILGLKHILEQKK